MTRCRLCQMPVATDTPWCTPCAKRLKIPTTQTRPPMQTCRTCQRLFDPLTSRQVFCDVECRRLYNQRATKRTIIDHDTNADLSEAEIEQRFQSHMAYLRATRKYQVDPYQQGRHAVPLPQYE